MKFLCTQMTVTILSFLEGNVFYVLLRKTNQKEGKELWSGRGRQVQFLKREFISCFFLKSHDYGSQTHFTISTFQS